MDREVGIKIQSWWFKVMLESGVVIEFSPEKYTSQAFMDHMYDDLVEWLKAEIQSELDKLLYTNEMLEGEK